MEDRLTVALALQGNPGVYALLLGSGLSRAAGIPTGWEVVLSLIERLAAAADDTVGDDPAEWYRDRFDEEPGYSSILSRLARTPSERQAILREYFEPDEQEREEGLKAPTDAHRAIARLASKGVVRVVLTTNFDRLLELALEEEGVRPVVVWNADTAQGAVPLTHASYYVVKLHGDYLDTRILNTPEELSEYPEETDDLLSRILDEFGLLVCGWSSSWDTALRDAILREPGRRYSTFWASRGSPNEDAETLIQHRRATLVEIEDADEFFVDIESRVNALDDLRRPHPLTVEAAVAALKRVLPHPEDSIRFRDMLHRETERAAEVLNAERFEAGPRLADEELVARLEEYESAIEILEALFAVGAYWCQERHLQHWSDSLARIGTPSHPFGGTNVWIDLWKYPATRLLYAAGLVGLRRERYDLLYRLMVGTLIRRDHHNTERSPAVESLNSWVVSRDVGRRLPGMERRHTPASDRLFETLRGATREFIPDETDYALSFDDFEFFLALVYADVSLGADDINAHEYLRAPIGRFHWRTRHSTSDPSTRLTEALDNEGESWAPLKAGFFRGDLARARGIRERFDVFCSKVQMF